jgi:hypothetical protein
MDEDYIVFLYKVCQNLESIRKNGFRFTGQITLTDGVHHVVVTNNDGKYQFDREWSASDAL